LENSTMERNSVENSIAKKRTDSVCIVQNASEDALFNTTTAGGCRDCEDDRYVHLIMQKFVTRRTEEPVLDANLPVFDAESVDLAIAESHSPGVSVEQDATQLPSNNDLDPHASTVRVITSEPLSNDNDCDDDYQQAADNVNSTETNGHVRSQLGDLLPRPMTEKVDILPFLPDAIQQNFDNSKMFDTSINSNLALSSCGGLEHSNGDIPQTQFTFPLSKVECSDLFSSDGDTKGAIANNHVKCTLEPISSLFASCGAVSIPKPLTLSEKPVNMSVVQNQLPETEQPYATDFSNIITSTTSDTTTTSSFENSGSPPTDNADNNPSNSSADTEALAATATNTSNKLSLPTKNACSDVENSPRNTSPPSSPFLESVRA
uniref:Protein aurora borealis n=1 Tax=Echinostoma caproni TaxID=27848 RepID=A0A183BBT7_9TREM